MAFLGPVWTVFPLLPVRAAGFVDPTWRWRPPPWWLVRFLFGSWCPNAAVCAWLRGDWLIWFFSGLVSTSLAMRSIWFIGSFPTGNFSFFFSSQHSLDTVPRLPRGLTRQSRPFLLRTAYWFFFSLFPNWGKTCIRTESCFSRLLFIHPFIKRYDLYRLTFHVLLKRFILVWFLLWFMI